MKAAKASWIPLFLVMGAAAAAVVRWPARPVPDRRPNDEELCELVLRPYFTRLREPHHSRFHLEVLGRPAPRCLLARFAQDPYTVRPDLPGRVPPVPAGVKDERVCVEAIRWTTPTAVEIDVASVSGPLEAVGWTTLVVWDGREWRVLRNRVRWIS